MNVNMADFKFNFTDEGEERAEASSVPTPDRKPTSGTGETARDIVAQEIFVQPFHVTLLEHLSSTCKFEVPGTHPRLTLKYVDAGDITRAIRVSTGANSKGLESNTNQSGSGIENVTFRATIPCVQTHELQSLYQLIDTHHSDLISGVYEGGLKVWECAFDLTKYMAESGFEFQGRRVLELGCGVGLPGLLALVSGAACVHFQDYNREVVEFVTIPNVLLNGNRTQRGASGARSGTSVTSQCRFYAGDWSDFTTLIKPSRGCVENTPYDIILTSETIYSAASQPKLLTALKNLINPLNGVVFVAAKCHYFGVGGSVQMFQEFVESDGFFSFSKCKTFETNVPRTIMRLEPNQPQKL